MFGNSSVAKQLVASQWFTSMELVRVPKGLITVITHAHHGSVS
jgi:hypothetical protein